MVFSSPVSRVRSHQRARVTSVLTVKALFTSNTGAVFARVWSKCRIRVDQQGVAELICGRYPFCDPRATTGVNFERLTLIPTKLCKPALGGGGLTIHRRGVEAFW